MHYRPTVNCMWYLGNSSRQAWLLWWCTLQAVARIFVPGRSPFPSLLSHLRLPIPPSPPFPSFRSLPSPSQSGPVIQLGGLGSVVSSPSRSERRRAELGRQDDFFWWILSIKYCTWQQPLLLMTSDKFATAPVHGPRRALCNHFFGEGGWSRNAPPLLNTSLSHIEEHRCPWHLTGLQGTLSIFFCRNWKAISRGRTDHFRTKILAINQSVTGRFKLSASLVLPSGDSPHKVHLYSWNEVFSRELELRPVTSTIELTQCQAKEHTNI